MTAKTANVIVGNGGAVHALRKESQASAVLSYRDVRCGAGNSNRGGVYRQTRKMRRTDHDVTCKRCIAITESDAIWAGKAVVPAASETQKRALDIHYELIANVIKYGSAMWNAGSVAGEKEAYEAAHAKAEALWTEIERMGRELRDAIAA